MKVKCPKCKEPFEIDKNAYDEGDTVECAECGEFAIIEVKKGKFVLRPENSKYDDGDDFFTDDDN